MLAILLGIYGPPFISFLPSDSNMGRMNFLTMSAASSGEIYSIYTFGLFLLVGPGGNSRLVNKEALPPKPFGLASLKYS